MKPLYALLLLLLTPFAHAESFLTENTLSTWGYHTVNRIFYNSHFCGNSFKPLSVLYHGIKSIAPIKGKTDTYYRFTIIREQYSSKLSAHSRAKKLDQPARRTSKHAKLCNLTQSFTIDNFVYFIHTDAGLFTTEQKRVFQLFYSSKQK